MAARAGEIPEFTGISSPFEEPDNPEVLIHSDISGIEECVNKILEIAYKKIKLP